MKLFFRQVCCKFLKKGDHCGCILIFLLKEKQNFFFENTGATIGAKFSLLQSFFCETTFKKQVLRVRSQKWGGGEGRCESLGVAVAKISNLQL